MRVLNVNAVLDAVSGGGTAERTFQLSRFLARAGAECAILTLDVGLSPERIAALHPVKVTALRCVMPRFYLFRLPEPRLDELVRWADVVHLMGHWTMINALVYWAAHKLGNPYVVCPAGALPIYGRSRTLKTAYNRIIGTRIIRNADTCVAIGSNEIAHFSSYGVSPDGIDLIPNGIDPDDFRNNDGESFRQKFGLSRAPFVLFLGRLNRIKGPDLLLTAFGSIAAALPDTHLVFAGPDNGMLGMLRQLATRFGIENRAHFIGPIRGQDKSRALHAACLLAVPSRQEAMSIVALEAGACGTPVLITDQCGFDEITESGGAIVVPADEAGLRGGLATLLKHPHELAIMGAKLREFVLQRYLWSHTAKRYLELFARVISARKAT
jgi:glycosyltransferase involved in cell wall biosynthesis